MRSSVRSKTEAQLVRMLVELALLPSGFQMNRCRRTILWPAQPRVTAFR